MNGTLVGLGQVIAFTALVATVVVLLIGVILKNGLIVAYGWEDFRGLEASNEGLVAFIVTMLLQIALLGAIVAAVGMVL